MSRTPVALLKAQLRLDDPSEDAFLEHKLNAAEAWIQGHIGAALPEGEVPAPLTEAALQLAAFWYEQREAAFLGTSGAPIPFGVHALLQSFREEVTGHAYPA